MIALGVDPQEIHLFDATSGARLDVRPAALVSTKE